MGPASTVPPWLPSLASPDRMAPSGPETTWPGPASDGEPWPLVPQAIASVPPAGHRLAMEKEGGFILRSLRRVAPLLRYPGEIERLALRLADGCARIIVLDRLVGRATRL